jgi:hypothetical protein
MTILYRILWILINWFSWKCRYSHKNSEAFLGEFLIYCIREKNVISFTWLTWSISLICVSHVRYTMSIIDTFHVLSIWIESMEGRSHRWMSCIKSWSWFLDDWMILLFLSTHFVFLFMPYILVSIVIPRWFQANKRNFHNFKWS